MPSFPDKISAKVFVVNQPDDGELVYVSIAELCGTTDERFPSTAADFNREKSVSHSYMPTDRECL